MMDIIQVPFGYLLDFLESSTGSFGIALILFSLILKIILLPMSCKSKKGAMKMARVAPRIKALEIECGEDKNKYQQEVSKLYKQEGLGCTGGCLWSFVPLLILIPLYTVIRSPIEYMMHLSEADAQQVVNIVQSTLGVNFGKFYGQMSAAAHVMDPEVLTAIQAQLPHVVDNLREINFSFLNLNMNLVPSWKFWTFTADWQHWGLFLIPLLSAGSQMLSGLAGQLMNNKVVTNDKGEEDKEAQKKANSTNRTMMLVMPLMSLYFCFTMPAAISVYWFAQSVFGVVQDIALSKYYGKKYALEDAQKKELAAIEAAKAAERERLRAERLAKYGEEGLLDPNTSKKKLKQQEQAAKKAAAEAYAASQKPETEQTPEEETDKHFSGDPERPYCRGRAYKPTRYGRKADEE